MADDHNLTAATDEQLIAATLRGDVSSFGTIVQRYWNIAVALALSKIHDAVEAEDIAQESFIKAYGQLHRLRNPSRLGGWLSKIVIQECVNNARRTGRSRIVLTYEDSVCEAVRDSALARSANPGLTDNQTDFIRQTVSRLPEKLQKLIIMRFVADLSAVQIAQQLGKRPGTVRVWLHRAYKILRRDLAPLLEEVE